MAKKTSETPQVRHTIPGKQVESQDIDFKLILGLLILICAGALIIHGAIWGWMTGLRQGPQRHITTEWQVLDTGLPAPENRFPVLQLDPQTEIEDYQRSQQRRMRSYGWVDPQKGIIQIPVDRAMYLIEQHGLPRFERTSAATNAKTEISTASAAQTAESNEPQSSTNSSNQPVSPLQMQPQRHPGGNQ